MFRKRGLRGAGFVFASLALVAIAWAGGDPWKSKTYQQWDDRDISRVFQESPWVSKGTTGGTWKPLGSDTATGELPNSTPSTGKDTRPAIGMAPQETGPFRPQVTNVPRTFMVQWYSSRTIRSAYARNSVLHNGKDPTQADQFVHATIEDFAILVRGQDMTPFTASDEKTYAAQAYLEMKKAKQKVTPSRVEFQRAADGKTVVAAIFYFPRKTANGPTINPDEKEIDFNCKIAGSTLMTYFEPQKMQDQQGSDL
ncbi:MAG: hypothetical protein WBP79_14895 [Candidatus Acidiferrales bacterium]